MKANSHKSSIVQFIVSILLIYNVCFIAAQTPIQYNWRNLAIGGGGFVSGIVNSPLEKGLMYCRTDVGGAYRWDTLNNSWIPLLDWASENETSYQGVEAIAIDPKDPNIVYISIGTSYFNSGISAILRSTDRGKTFTKTNVTSQFKIHGNGMGRNTGEKMAIDPKNSNIIFYGSRWNGVFKSINSGKTWTKIANLDTKTTNENGVSFVLFGNSDAPTDTFTQTIIVGITRSGTTPNLYKSIDGGSTFSELTGGPTDLMPQRAVLSPDSNVYITYGNGAGPYGTTAEPMNEGKVLMLNPKLNVFTDITPTNFTGAFSGVSIDPTNPKRIIVSSINTYKAQGKAYGDQFFLTTDGGQTWTNIVARGFQIDPNGVSWMSSAQSIHWAACILFDPFNTKKVYVVSGNGLFSTDDIDAKTCIWKFTVKGLEETVAYDVITLPQGPVISIIADYDGFRNFKVDEYGPQLTPTMGSTSGLAYAGLQSNVVLRAGSSLYYSLSAGESWILCKKTAGKNGYVAVSADGKIFLHSPDKAGLTYYSKDKGNTWTESTGISVYSQPVADPVNANKFYLYNNSFGVIMLSTDGGASFTEGGSVGSGGSVHIRTVPGKEGHLWVALYGGGLKRSIDGGLTFTKIPNVSSCSAVGIGKAKPGSSYHSLFIWGEIDNITGIFTSSDEGATWNRINDDNHEYGGLANGQFIIGDLNVYGRVFMSTAGRGIICGTPLFDCHNDSLGSAFIDDCDICVEGNTGNTACKTDCNGVLGGTASFDACGICSGGNTGLTPTTDPAKCKIDCNGDPFGTATKDGCGICSGGNTGVEPCNTGVNSGNTNKLFSYSPNPFKSGLNIQTKIRAHYKVINLYGVEVESGLCNDHTVIAKSLPQGIYFLEVMNNADKESAKVIKVLE